MEEQARDLINDNSKRIVSLRMNTSDFGRVKAIARRFRARDSDVLRLVFKLGLAELEALCRRDATPDELLSVFVAHGRELVRHFDLDARRMEQIVNADAPARLRITPADLELIALCGRSEQLLAARLEEVTGSGVTPDHAQRALAHYLEARYLNGTSAGDAENER